jgi:hypothetical protein
MILSLVLRLSIGGWAGMADCAGMAEEEQRLVSGGDMEATDGALLATATDGNVLIGAAVGSVVSTTDSGDIRQDQRGARTDRRENISMTSGLTDETSQPTCGISTPSVQNNLNGLSGPVDNFSVWSQD